MNIAKESVYNYQKSLKDKLGLGNRQELMLYAIQHGIAKVARYTSYYPNLHELAVDTEDVKFKPTV